MTAIGIDLGTTNSVAATYDPARERSRVLTIDGARSMPSVVSVQQQDGAEELLIGHNALNWASRAPQDTIISVKRLMGRDFDDPSVEQARARRSYRIVPGPGEDPRAHVMLGDTIHTPGEISAFILQRVKSGAEQTLGDEVTHAVITVPAYFQEAQRAATREAGERAGLVIKRIIDEPTAAAIAFGVELDEDDRRRVLVYDLGGGTFDISVLNTTTDKQGHRHFQVLEFNGDNWLGGDDFDDLIVGRILDWVKRNADIDASEDAEFLFHAKDAAQKARIFLSGNNSTKIVIPSALRAGGEPIDVVMPFTRAELDELIEPLVERTIDLVKIVLERQKLNAADITDVLLVGGATLTPKVYENVTQLFGKSKVRRDVDPMECVAIGAGILANTLRGKACQSCNAVNDDTSQTCVECGHSLTNATSNGETNIHDVTGMALGVRAVQGTHEDVFVPIIHRGTPYPMSEPMRHSFGATSSGLIRVPVYEGDHSLASKNREQGVIEYELPEEIDVHSRVDVAFMFDRNRELHVTITVPGTGLEYTKKLRIDAPRTKPGSDTPLTEDEYATDRADLALAQRAITALLHEYGEYLDPPQAMKLRGDLDRTAQVLIFAEPAECRRMLSILTSDLINSGLASALYLAARAADRAPTAEEARRINQTVESVQKAFKDGKRSVVQDQARVLKVLVANTLYGREVPEIGDVIDHNGLLKLL